MWYSIIEKLISLIEEGISTKFGEIYFINSRFAKLCEIIGKNAKVQIMLKEFIGHSHNLEDVYN